MSSASTFGQNQWLVDEMFQQFQEDPQSVDPEWRELFETQGAPNGATPPAAPAKPTPTLPPASTPAAAASTATAATQPRSAGSSRDAKGARRTQGKKHGPGFACCGKESRC